MSDRFIHTFDEWMNRVNKRLQRLERRLGVPGSGGGGEVPDPLTIGTINVTTLDVTGKATVPEPIDADDATTKGYVDAGDADTLADANAHADAAAAAAQAAATQQLTAGTNVTVTGTGLPGNPWVVSASGGGADPVGPWQDITLNSAYQLLSSSDLWQVRAEGDSFSWSQALVRPIANLTLTAAQVYSFATLPPAFASAATRRGLYTSVMIRGATNTITTGLLYLAPGSTAVMLIPSTTVTLTGSTTNQYFVVEPRTWVSGF